MAVREPEWRVKEKDAIVAIKASMGIGMSGLVAADLHRMASDFREAAAEIAKQGSSSVPIMRSVLGPFFDWAWSQFGSNSPASYYYQASPQIKLQYLRARMALLVKYLRKHYREIWAVDLKQAVRDLARSYVRVIHALRRRAKGDLLLEL